ncbi:MAG: transposase [Rhodomicrobium sp.]
MISRWLPLKGLTLVPLALAINPRQLDRFRDRFSPAGAKDDSRDAETLSSSLRTDRRAFHQVSLAGLREWSRVADDLRADQIRHAKRHVRVGDARSAGTRAAEAEGEEDGLGLFTFGTNFIVRHSLAELN